MKRLGEDLSEDAPPEVASLGRTLLPWKDQIAAWHQTHVSNGPTEAVDNLIKCIKRIKRIALFALMLVRGPDVPQSEVAGHERGAYPNARTEADRSVDRRPDA